MIDTYILYCAKISWVFNFANFANFQPFVKIFVKIFGTRRAVCVCSEFAKLFQQNHYSRKFRLSKILHYTVDTYIHNSYIL